MFAVVAALAVAQFVRVSLTNSVLLARLLVTVVEKFASSPSAAASSFRVSKAPGADATSPATALLV